MEYVFNPSHGFGIADFAQISLGRREIGMPENNLADNFNGCAGPAGKGGRMPSEVVWTDFNADLSAGLFNDLPCAGITEWENSLVGFNLL